MTDMKSHRPKIFLLVLTLVLVIGCGTAAYISSAGRISRMKQAEQITGGNAARGLALMERYGCGSCHNAEGLPRLAPGIAPPLESLTSRAYIAGVLENKPENLVRWIVDPPAIDPLTAMPVVGVTELDARDIAAYLYSLE